MAARTSTRHQQSGASATWTVPLESSPADLNVDGGVSFKWLHNGGLQPGLPHLGNFGPRFGYCKDGGHDESVLVVVFELTEREEGMV